MTDHMFSVIQSMITVGVILIVLFLVGRWILLPVELPELTVDTVSEIEVIDGATGYGVYISDPEDIEKILPKFSELKLDRKGIMVFPETDAYQITFYGENGIKMSGFNAFYLSADNRAGLAPFYYVPSEGTFPVEDIAQVVTQAIIESEEQNQTENQTK